jgi:hypothetical protein
MATYYKYAEQSADSQINWAEIGKNLSDTLQEANKIREDKKEALNQSTREFSKTLANSPQGEDALANQRTLDFASDMTELMLIQENLFKSGQTKFKDYAIVRQNSIDSTEQLFGLSQEYQEEYKKKMERMKAGTSSKKEQLEMQQVEGYANLSTMKPYINPTNGNVSMAKVTKKEIDGKIVEVMDDNPDNYLGVNDAKNRIKSYWDKFDVTKALVDVESVLGKNVESFRNAGGLFKAGEIVTVDDVTNKKDFEDAKNLYVKAEDNFITGLLSNGFNVESVLLDHKVFAEDGKEYDYTFNKNDQSPNKILMKVVNGISVMDEEGKYYKDQYAASTDYMKKQLRVMLDREVKRDTYSEPANFAPDYGRGSGDDNTVNKKDAANMLGYFYYGTPAQIKAAVNYFKGTDPSIVDINRQNDRIIIERKDDKGNTTYKSIYMQQGSQRLSQKDFIQSASPELAKINDIFKGLDEGSYVQGKPLSLYDTKKGISNRTVTAEENMSKKKGTGNINTSQYNEE